MRPKPMFLSIWAFAAGLSLLVILLLATFFANVAWQASGGGSARFSPWPP